MKYRLALSAAVVCTALLWTGPTRAYHELDCGLLRPIITDETTGQRRCGPVSRDALEQVLRSRKLRQEQDRRARDLRLKQRQRAKAQELISQRKSENQRFDQGHPPTQHQRVLDRQQAVGPRGVLNLAPPIPYDLDDLNKYQQRQ